MKYVPAKYLMKEWKNIDWRKFKYLRSNFFNILNTGDIEKIKNEINNILQILQDDIKKKTIKPSQYYEDITFLMLEVNEKIDSFLRLEERGKYR